MRKKISSKSKKTVRTKLPETVLPFKFRHFLISLYIFGSSGSSFQSEPSRFPWLRRLPRLRYFCGLKQSRLTRTSARCKSKHARIFVKNSCRRQDVAETRASRPLQSLTHQLKKKAVVHSPDTKTISAEITILRSFSSKISENSVIFYR